MKATKTALHAAHSQPQPRQPMTEDRAFEVMCLYIGDWNEAQEQIDIAREYMVQSMEFNRWDGIEWRGGDFAAQVGKLNAMLEVYARILGDLTEGRSMQQILDRVIRFCTKEVMNFVELSRFEYMSTNSIANVLNVADRGAQAKFYHDLIDRLGFIRDELAQVA